MDTIDKSEYPDVFSKDEEMYKEDIEFFATIFKKNMPEKERYFFEKMKEKVEGVFAPSADIMMFEEHYGRQWRTREGWG